MNPIKAIKQEPYEAPAILDLAPVTIITGQAPGGSDNGNGGDDGGYEGDI